MARIRTIKPEFWTDEKLAECSVPARLLFIGTWNFADDEGRMEYSPKRLKMQIFPGDNIEVAPLVAELASRSLVMVYRAGNRELFAIPNFNKHQRIDHPRASTIPAPIPADSQNTPRRVKENYVNDPRTLAPEGNGIEGNGIEDTKTSPLSELKTSSDSVSPSHRKKKQIKTALPENFGISEAVEEWARAGNYGQLEKRLDHFLGYVKAHGKTYADWDTAFKNAIRDDWANLGHGNVRMANAVDEARRQLAEQRPPTKLKTAIEEAREEAAEREAQRNSLGVGADYRLPADLDRDAGEEIWRSALEKLEAVINRHSFDTWLRPLKPAGVRDQVLYLKLPTVNFSNVGDKYARELAEVLPGLKVKFLTPQALQVGCGVAAD